MIKQSFCLPCFQPKNISLLDFFNETRAIGYVATELWGPPDNLEELVSLAKKSGLIVASMGGHNSLQDGLNKKENHDRIEAELIKNIEVAKQHGIPGLICFSGDRNPGQADEEAKQNTADGLLRVAPHAEKAGINLNLELLNSKIDHPGYQCNHTAWGVDVVRRVDSSRVKLLYDIYHMQIMEGDVIRTIRENIKWIGHFHTAGNPGRKDLDDLQELNYRGICQAISETGYSLYVGHEFFPKEDKLQGLKQAFDLCNV